MNEFPSAFPSPLRRIGNGATSVVEKRQDRTTVAAVTETLSIKVPVQTKARLKSVAKNRHTSPSALLREALDLVLAGKAATSRTSIYELSRDLFEGEEGGGPKDLSTNKRYLDDLGR